MTEKTYTLTEVIRLLKNVQSLKCRSKAMNRPVKLAEALKEEERLLKIKSTLEQPKTKVDIKENLESLTLIEVNKAIKNAQSKKCLALAMNRQQIVLEQVEIEEQLKLRRQELIPKENQTKLRTKLEILEMIKELEKLDTIESRAKVEVLKLVVNLQG